MPGKKTQDSSHDRAYASSPRVGVGIVLLLGGKLVLVKRKHAPARSRWTLPGGLVELGESVQAAVKREAREELGIEVDIDRLLDVLDFIDKDAFGKIRYHYILLDYLTSAAAGNLQPGSDVAAIALAGASDVFDYDLPDLTRTFIHRHFTTLFPPVA